MPAETPEWIAFHGKRCRVEDDARSHAIRVDDVGLVAGTGAGWKPLNRSAVAGQQVDGLIGSPHRYRVCAGHRQRCPCKW